MDDSFRVRVEKVFGSLSSSPASAAAAAPPPSNLWCLSDEEIEKRELNRDRSDSSTDDDDEEEEDEARQPSNPPPQQPINPLTQKPPSNNVVDTGIPEEDWEIRTSMGRDCTLDFEEEEDEFDKLAVGREEFVGGERFYDREIDDYGVDYHDPNVIATSFEGVVDRDPRADRRAANLKLIEDSKAAGVFVGDSTTLSIKLHEEEEDKVNNPKPILKKREKNGETKSQKRVRFSGDDDCCSKEDTSFSEEDSPQELAFPGETKAAEASSSMDEPTSLLKTDFPRQVPDYIQNPSRYTCYTLDSADEVDEASNVKAYMEFSKLLNKQKADDGQLDEFDPSFPPIFTPKMKTRMDEDSSPLKMDTMSDADNPVVITAAAAANTDDDGVCDMDEDLQEDDLNRNRGSNKASRQYRSRTSVDHDDPVG